MTAVGLICLSSVDKSVTFHTESWVSGVEDVVILVLLLREQQAARLTQQSYLAIPTVGPMLALWLPMSLSVCLSLSLRLPQMFSLRNKKNTLTAGAANLSSVLNYGCQLGKARSVHPPYLSFSKFKSDPELVIVIMRESKDHEVTDFLKGQLSADVPFKITSWLR